MLPKANCVFKLSSLHDGTELDCRLYFPKRPFNVDGTKLSGFAIFAHPYAPLGGCYDDPIVHEVGSILLRKGFVLCTFNFRGASGSTGSTSWTGRAELADYVSVCAFVLLVLNTPKLLNNTCLRGGRPLLVLGGYSYGSMIASHLPSLETIESAYTFFHEKSLREEYELRVHEVAQVLLAFIQLPAAHRHDTFDPEHGIEPADLRPEIMIGGHDSEHASGRKRRNSIRRSIDRDLLRHGVDKVKNRLTLKHHNEESAWQESPIDSDVTGRPPFSVRPDAAFLLISPLLQPVVGFATVFHHLVFEIRNSAADAKSQTSISTTLSENSTLVVYGDRDIFTSTRRMRRWAQDLDSMPQSQFKSQEVAGAGHFWHDHEHIKRLRSAISTWAKSLLDTMPVDQNFITKP